MSSIAHIRPDVNSGVRASFPRCFVPTSEPAEQLDLVDAIMTAVKIHKPYQIGFKSAYPVGPALDAANDLVMTLAIATLPGTIYYFDADSNLFQIEGCQLIKINRNNGTDIRNFATVAQADFKEADMSEYERDVDAFASLEAH